jgi:sulfide:quinone oxidoreductase
VFQDGAREPFDLLAAVPPHRPPEAVKQSPLASETGWVPVDKRTRRTRFDNVYTVGDVATMLPSYPPVRGISTVSEPA